MLYVNQSYNYLIRKRSNYIEPIKLSCNTDYNKQHKGNSQQTAPYTLVKDLITKYGKSWLNLNIPQFLTDQKEFAINNKYLSDIEEYMQNNGLNQFSIVANIKNVYNGLIIENDRNAIKPYELDIYLPDLKYYDDKFLNVFKTPYNILNAIELNSFCKYITSFLYKKEQK